MSFECRGGECPNFDANCRSIIDGTTDGEGEKMFDNKNFDLLVTIAKGACGNSAGFVESAGAKIQPDDCGYMVREEFLADPVTVLAERTQ